MNLLKNTTVVDFSRLLPGPFCTMVLADLGARVIAAEPPSRMQGVSGTEMPSLYRGKERMEVDLKSDFGGQVRDALVARADVVVHGFMPKTAERLGLSYERLKSLKPDLVYCALTGYGPGPAQDRAGHDVNLLAEAGMLELLVPPDSDALPALQVADTSGALLASTAICAALAQRQRTGEGARLEIPMAASGLFQAITSETFRSMGQAHGAGQSAVAGGLACYGLYRTKDDRRLALGALEPHFFRTVLERLGLQGQVTKQFVPSEQPALRALLAGTFAARTGEEWAAEFADLEACVTIARSFDEAMDSPGPTAGPAVVDLKLPNGSTRPGLRTPLPPLSPPKAGVSPGPLSPPEAGQHTAAILAELDL